MQGEAQGRGRPRRFFSGCTLAALACAGLACAEPPSLPLPPAEAAPVQRLSNAEYIAAIEALFLPLQLDIAPTALPVSVDVDGFDNHVDLSAPYPSVVESYRLLALEVSARVWRDLPVASGCQETQAACVRSWLEQLSEQVLWRSPSAPLLDSFDAWREDYGLEEATRLSLQLLMLSPDFSYAPRSGNPGEGAWAPVQGRALARRLAFTLWGAPPDRELLDAADAGALESAEGVREQTLRMLDDPRARAGVLRFYSQLLEWDRALRTTLDPDYYLIESPHVANDNIEELTEEFAGEYLRFRLQPAIRAESELFVQHQLFEGPGSFEALLTGTESFATWDLAELVYGVGIDDSGEPVRVLPGPIEELSYPMYPMQHEPSERGGLLTFAAFLHGHAGPIQPSPVRRGVFVMERLMCQPPAAPPGDVPPLEESAGGEDGEALTNRERFAAHTENPACQACHLPIDSIGFTFEGFDSLGELRNLDAGQPVDTSGALFGTDRDGPVDGALQLSRELAQSRTAHDCHVLNWFRFAFGRSAAAEDEALLAALEQQFWDSGGDVLGLLVDITTSEAFRHWRLEP